jgi:hypothetical protein
MEAFQFVISFLISFILIYLVGMISVVALFKLFFKVEHGDPYNLISKQTKMIK